MAYLVLAYPELKNDDFNRIQSYREKKMNCFIK